MISLMVTCDREGCTNSVFVDEDTLMQIEVSDTCFWVESDLIELPRGWWIHPGEEGKLCPKHAAQVRADAWGWTEAASPVHEVGMLWNEVLADHRSRFEAFMREWDRHQKGLTDGR